MGSTPLLQSIQILITGVPDGEKQRLRDAARAQGAVVLSSVNPNDPPHVVVVRVAGTPRYLSALRRCPRLPVVTPDWLTASLAAGARLPYAAHAAGALQGLKVCFSGLPVAEKQELSGAVLAAGAAHSTSLDRSCTHLVAETTQSDKYVFARHNKIACVSPAWVRDSLQAGRCLDPEKYPVGGPSAATAATASLTAAGTSSQQHSQGAGRGGPGGGGLARQASLSRAAAAVAQETQRSGGDDGDCAAAEAPPAPAAPPEPWAGLDCDDGAPNFLENCCLWVVGCTAAEETESMALAAAGGAKRFWGDSGPHPTLTTHVVVGGARVGPAEAEAAAALAAERRDVAVVGLDWLRCSVARESAMPADERFRAALPAPPRGALPPGGGAGTLDAAPSLASAPPGDLDAAPLLRQASLAGGSGSGVPGFLDGSYFTLAAVRGMPEGAAAERLIRCHGGRLFSATAPPGARAVYAICPHSFPPAAASALRGSAPDFAAVPEAQRFTLYWLECCCEAGRAFPPAPGAPCYQPLPYGLPLPGMGGVSVAISGYDPVVRAAIQRHVEIAGGHVSVEYMTAKQTHLIVPAAAGKKYMYAGRYGVIPVTADWLVQSLAAGRVLPPEAFAPLLPSGAPAPAAPPGGSDRAGSASAPTQGVRTQAPLPAAKKGSGGVPKPALATAVAPSSQARGGGSGSAATGSAARPSSTASGATGPPRGKLKQRIAEHKAAAAAAAAQKPAPAPAPAPAPRPAFDFDSLFGEDAGNGGGSGGGGGPSRSAAADAATTAIASVLGRPGGAGSQGLMPPPAPVTRPSGAATATAVALPGVSPPTAAAPAIPGRSARASPPAPPAPPPPPPVSETQDDGGALDAALASLKDQLGRIGQRGSTAPSAGGKASGAGAASATALAVGSQIDMPPPSVRTVGRERKGRAEKRTRSATTLAGGSEGSDGVGGAAARRSKRRGAQAALESESELMAGSQQVGYEAVAVDVEAMEAAAAGGGGAGGGTRAAKERLTRAAAKQRRGLAAHSADALDAIS